MEKNEYSLEDVYIAYLKAKAGYEKRGWRIPKDAGAALKKLSEKNRVMVAVATQNFNTKWIAVDPETYFLLGFEYFKGRFAYHRFTDRRLMSLYVTRMKARQYEEENDRENIERSLEFIEGFMRKYEIKSIAKYMNSVVGSGMIPAVVLHWRRGKVDLTTMVFLMARYRDAVRMEGDIVDTFLGSDFRSQRLKVRYKLMGNDDLREFIVQKVKEIERRW